MMQSAMTPRENRRFPRMVVDCPIEYRPVDSDEARQGLARNISGNGMLFVARERERPVVGAVLEVQVRPGHPSIPALDALVEIVRVQETTDASGSLETDGDFEIGAVILSMK